MSSVSGNRLRVDVVIPCYNEVTVLEGRVRRTVDLFARHGAEAHRLRLPLRVVREPSLSHDVDLPADLVAFRALARS